MAGFSNSISNNIDCVFAHNGDFSGASNPNDLNGLQTNGQLWIGATVLNAGGTHINVGTITSPGGTITVGFSTPNITIDVTGGGFSWVDISGGFSALKNTGYFITGTATGTLPATPAQGDTIKFFVDHASQLLTLQASGTQIIRMGSLASSAGGTFVSTLQGDSVELVYRAVDTCWCAVCGFVGTWVKT
jgi:hypothetical protein